MTEARRLRIVAKQRPYPLAVVQPDHFVTVDAGPVDLARTLDRPEVSLYCLDPERRAALFVEVPVGTDLCEAPFFYQAQYEAAESLIAVPYDTLHALADTIDVDERRLILVYSVGRCGSTLVSRAFRHAPGITSHSEPDVFTQLVMLRGTGHPDADVSRLVRTCTRVLCRSGQGWAFKFRSFGIELADLFHEHYPRARVMFLYRHATPWAQSNARAFQGDEPYTPDTMRTLIERIGPLSPALHRFAAPRGGLLTRMEFIAAMWVAYLEHALAMRDRGSDPFITRYEDLTTDPYRVLDALFVHCGLRPLNRHVLEQVLAEDSQAGSDLARDSLVDGVDAVLTEAERAELARAVPELNPLLTVDSVLPDTRLSLTR